MSRYLQEAHLSDWMTKRKTTFIQKDPRKSIAPNNYKPITCLPFMWKILIAQIREMIHFSLTKCRLFPEQENGYCKASRDTELLSIDQQIHI